MQPWFLKEKEKGEENRDIMKRNWVSHPPSFLSTIVLSILGIEYIVEGV